MVRLEPRDVVFFASLEELHAWLETNHATSAELWMGFPSKASGRQAMAWSDAVDELLCFGWIDGVLMPYQGARAIRVTPRRPRSIWSARNVGRVEALRAVGRMEPAGEAAFARRRDERTGIYSFDGAWPFDEDALAVMRARPDAWAFFEAQPAGYRRQAAHWVMSAKRPETRERRLGWLLDGCAAGERLPQITGVARAGRG